MEIPMMDLENSFLDHFSDLEDPRSKRNQLYSMAEILLSAFCAMIAGSLGWQDVQDYANSKINYLKKMLPYKNGTPSDDTFRRFFRSIDPESFQRKFREWVTETQPHLSSKVIAIDGKSSRHSFDGAAKMLHTVSAYATDARLVLAQEKVSEKSNEIKAIPEVLEWLDIKGNIVTIDAMGCQHKIADKIVSKQGDYILALKGNQGSLSEDVQKCFSENKTLDVFEDYDKGHGRIEHRKCYVINDVDKLKKTHPLWKSINSIVKIESSREIKETISHETRYYISSLKGNSQKVLHAVRSHWAIENSLHWVLDMSFSDDQSRIRKENAPQVMAIMRHAALNLLQLKKATMKRMSIRRLQKMADRDDAVLSSILFREYS